MSKLELTLTPDQQSGWFTGVVRNKLIKHLSALQHGRIRLVEQGREQVCGVGHGLDVEVVVLDPSTYVDIASGGIIGAAEAYMAGKWTSSNLTQTVQLLVKNREILEALDSGSWYNRLANKAFHWWHRNTKEGSRENIHAHYDLGNAFFQAFLDPSMMYSSAIFSYPDQRLHDASIHKLETICRKLNLQPTDHLLEIGTGWGSLAIHAAQHYGCKVTTTTISQEQFDYAQLAVAKAGLSDKVTLLCQDYRDLEGQYDKLVSVEMIEAVGAEFLPTFFQTCNALLKPDGLMLIQAITIADQHFEAYRRRTDFIQRFIFPGGCLPSIEVMARHISQQTQLNIVQQEDITQHYALTLEHWRERFKQAKHDILKMGYDDVFCRMWEFYLCYCEGGFRERAIGTTQILAAGPDFRYANAWTRRL